MADVLIEKRVDLATLGLRASLKRGSIRISSEAMSSDQPRPAPYTMQVFRRLLILFLSACLGLQGASLASATEVPCPMQAEMEAMVLAGTLDPADLPTCCNDMQTWDESGQLCKTVLDYPGLVAWAPAPATLAVSAAPTVGPPGAPKTFEPNAPPGALWRPPTAS